MWCLQNTVDIKSLTVTGLILSLDMKNILIRLKVLLLIVVVKKTYCLYIVLSVIFFYFFTFYSLV